MWVVLNSNRRKGVGTVELIFVIKGRKFGCIWSETLRIVTMILSSFLTSFCVSYGICSEKDVASIV